MLQADIHLEMLGAIAERLGDLLHDVVFLGGCTTGLLITDRASPDVRPTTDVDLIVEVSTTHDYHAIESRMRKSGFQPDMSSGIKCRWKVDNMLVDLMPTDEAILGFSNKWYPETIDHAVPQRLPNGLEIRRVTAPYFIATKIVAFLDRGWGDFIASHDFEDIVAVIDGRQELADEIANANTALQTFIAETFQIWLHEPKFQQALPGHLPHDSVKRERLEILIKRIKKIAKI